jgi:hypothetical protein
VFHRVGLSLRGMGSETTHTPFSLPIPNVLCQTFSMRNLTATVCLTIAVLLGSVGVSWGSDEKDIQFQKIEFKDGVDAVGSKAISESLGEHVTASFKLFFTESHFPYGPHCSNKNSRSCRQNLRYELQFNAASIDLDGDGVNEFIVGLNGPNECGSGGCTSYILKNYPEGWRKIGWIFPGGKLEASRSYTNGFRTIKYYGKWGKKSYPCVYTPKKEEYVCP